MVNYIPNILIKVEYEVKMIRCISNHNNID